MCYDRSLLNYKRLSTQLENLDIPFTNNFDKSLKESDHVIDAIFGLSH